jgi:hypothetical protein
MTNPSWKDLARKKVEAKPDGLWNMVVPYVSGPRLLRLTVVELDDQQAVVGKTWRPTANDQCSANGILKTAQSKSPFLLDTAPFGALIGKIGGSTADLPDTSPTAGPYPGKKPFACGEYAVVALASTDSGPLFLSMNDGPEFFADHAGELWVLIEEAPV